MKTVRAVRAIAPFRRARLGAGFWIVFGLACAWLEGMRAWSALTSGQIKFPMSFGAMAPFTRSTEPLMFHAALGASLLIALACASIAIAAWRNRDN